MSIPTYIYLHSYAQDGKTALLMACSEGHEEAGEMLVAPTHAAGAIDVRVCELLYVSLSLLRHRRAGVQRVLGLRGREYDSAP